MIAFIHFLVYIFHFLVNLLLFILNGVLKKSEIIQREKVFIKENTKKSKSINNYREIKCLTTLNKLQIENSYKSYFISWKDIITNTYL